MTRCWAVNSVTIMVTFWARAFHQTKLWQSLETSAWLINRIRCSSPPFLYFIFHSISRRRDGSQYIRTTAESFPIWITFCDVLWFFVHSKIAGLSCFTSTFLFSRCKRGPSTSLRHVSFNELHYREGFGMIRFKNGSGFQKYCSQCALMKVFWLKRQHIFHSQLFSRIFETSAYFIRSIAAASLMKYHQIFMYAIPSACQRYLCRFLFYFKHFLKGTWLVVKISKISFQRSTFYLCYQHLYPSQSQKRCSINRYFPIIVTCKSPFYVNNR